MSSPQADAGLPGVSPAHRAAYGPGGYVGQEGFMRAGDILGLARRAGVGPGTSVLDLCCGAAGPGRLVVAELGCGYLGIDRSPGTVAVARQRTAGLGCRFEVAVVPPVPRGGFDVVLLLETMLAFCDKQPLLWQVSRSLRPGGRFAFTVAEGEPLTRAERTQMPDADTVWPVRMPQLLACLAGAGLRVRWQRDCSQEHRAVVDGLVDALRQRVSASPACGAAYRAGRLLAGHRLWSRWLADGRVRKHAVVAQKPPA